jgi:hypothetical protein
MLMYSFRQIIWSMLIKDLWCLKMTHLWILLLQSLRSITSVVRMTLYHILALRKLFFIIVCLIHLILFSINYYLLLDLWIQKQIMSFILFWLCSIQYRHRILLWLLCKWFVIIVSLRLLQIFLLSILHLLARGTFSNNR